MLPLATPAGLLLNEMVHAPAPLVGALREMLAAALELDVGLFEPRGPAAAALYVLRLLVRVEGYMLALEALAAGQSEGQSERQSEGPSAGGGRSATASSASVSSAPVEELGGAHGGAPIAGGWSSLLRERLRGSSERLQTLRRGRLALREQMESTAVPMVRQWLSKAVRAQHTESTCALRAHLAYLHRNVRASELTPASVATMLSSQVYLATNFEGLISLEPADAVSRPQRRLPTGGEDRRGTWLVPPAQRQGLAEMRRAAVERATRAHEALMLSPLETFCVYQRHRPKVLSWLEREGGEATSVSHAGSRRPSLQGAQDSAVPRPSMSTTGERGAVLGTSSASSSSLRPPSGLPQASLVLEAIVHVLSDGPAAEAADVILGAQDGASLLPRTAPTSALAATAAAAAATTARAWVGMGGNRANRGRFVLSAEETARRRREAEWLAAAQTALAAGGAVGASGGASRGAAGASGGDALGYEEWLWRTTTAAVDMEVNVQLGEFTLRTNPVQLLAPTIPTHPDFMAATAGLLGTLDEQRRLHCALHSATLHREWMQLVCAALSNLAPLVASDGAPCCLAACALAAH